MFVEREYKVITQEEKSTRVWHALENKLSKAACNMITYVWLSEQPGSDMLIFKYIHRVFEVKASIETNFSDPLVLEMKQIGQQVSKERLYIIQFLRFQKAADDIFFAGVSPACNALPLAISHFKDRFADQKWVIYDLKRRYGYYYDLHTVEEITFANDEHLLGGKLNEELMAEDEKEFQELWKAYFKSMTIKERINHKLHRQHMPVRFWKYLTEKQ